MLYLFCFTLTEQNDDDDVYGFNESYALACEPPTKNPHSSHCLWNTVHKLSRNTSWCAVQHTVEAQDWMGVETDSTEWNWHKPADAENDWSFGKAGHLLSFAKHWFVSLNTLVNSSKSVFCIDVETTRQTLKCFCLSKNILFV